MIRRFAFVVVGCIVSACATASVKGVAKATAPVTPAGDPLIVVDGAVQERAVPQPAADTVSCKAAAPLYVIDGMKTCRRP